MKLSQIDPKKTRAAMFLLIGPQGGGKSIAAASFPNVKMYENEGKIESTINWYHQPEFRKYADNIDIDPIPDIIEFVYGTLQDYARDIKHPPFDSIVVDSITNTSRDIITAMLGARKRGEKVTGGSDKPKMAPGGMMLPSWDEFDAEDTLFMTMLSFLITIKEKFDINVICTAHPHTVQGPTGTSTMRIVAKGHKAPQTVINAFQEIYHIQTVAGVNLAAKPSRICRIHGETFCRTAWPFLPASFDFTNRAFYEVLKEELDKGLGGQQNERTVTKQTQSLGGIK